jgi:Fur family ferric uptake transcriptional regulator
VVGSSVRENSRQILDRSSKRVTTQRALLLDLIRKSDGHMDADELYRKARRKYPRISLSTVYRNLQVFKELGLVEKHHFAEEHHLFEAKPTAEHQHLLCLGCGKIVEFACPLSSQFKDEIANRYDFKITSVEVQMKGLCSSCSKKNNSSR